MYVPPYEDELNPMCWWWITVQLCAVASNIDVIISFWPERNEFIITATKNELYLHETVPECLIDKIDAINKAHITWRKIKNEFDKHVQSI